MTKKLATATLVFAVCLHAADFWNNVFTDWTDKEVQKMLDSSPWAKKVDVVPGGAAGVNAADRFSTGGIGNTKTPGSYSTKNGNDPVTICVRWESALPVKQAVMRMKYGENVGSTPEAQEVLGNPDPNYTVVVDGLNRKIIGFAEPDATIKSLMEQTELVVKGKDPIRPTDVKLSGEGRLLAVFVFPKTTPITGDDKDVEFQTKVGTVVIKQKFHLKDMFYFGKLAL